MKRMLDLCSGLGGASEAFFQSDEWDVIRIDDNPLLENIPHTIIGDIFDTTDRWERSGCPPVDLIWASPPCVEFSTAKTWAQGRTATPDLELVFEVKRIIDMIEPRHWVIENVMGAIPHFKPILGPPRLIVGPFVLWGNFPLFDIQGFAHSKAEHDVWSSNPLRANIKGKIPLEISTALLSALDTQSHLEDWI